MISFDGITGILSGNLVLILTGCFALIMVWQGYRKGFMIKLLSLLSLLAALVIEIIMYPRLMEFLDNLEFVKELYDRIGRAMLSGAVGGIIPDQLESAYGSAGAAFSGSPLYSFLGLDTLAEEAGRRVGQIVAGILCFILIFILIRICVRLLMAVARGLRKISIVKGLDSLLGAVFGAAEGLIYIWLFMLIVSGFPNIGICREALGQIFSSEILTWLYNNNLILLFFMGMIGAAV